MAVLTGSTAPSLSSFGAGEVKMICWQMKECWPMMASFSMHNWTFCTIDCLDRSVFVGGAWDSILLAFCGWQECDLLSWVCWAWRGPNDSISLESSVTQFFFSEVNDFVNACCWSCCRARLLARSTISCHSRGYRLTCFRCCRSRRTGVR